MDSEYEESFNNECACCFLCWQSDKEASLCEFCAERPWLPSDGSKRLKRMLEVMPKARVNRLPEVLKLMSQGLNWD